MEGATGHMINIYQKKNSFKPYASMQLERD